MLRPARQTRARMSRLGVDSHTVQTALTQQVTRRRFLAGALGIGALGLLAACGDDADPSPAATTAVAPTAPAEPTATAASTSTPPAAAATAPAATPSPASTSAPAAPATATTAPVEPTSPPATDGPWEFTDGRGVTVTLPQPPQRIVAFAAATGALWDFGVRPVGIYGIQRLADGSVEPTVGNADLDSMTSIGDTNDDIDIEALLALQPDLLISTMNTADAIWGMQDETAQSLVESVVPVVAMSAFFEPIDALIGHFEELAVALGGDPASSEAVAMRDAFDAASADIRSIAAAKPDLSVLACSGNNDNFFFSSTEMFPDLIYLASLGIQFVQPEGVEFNGPWGMVSWELVGQYQPDVILADSRRGWPPPAFQGQATYEGLAAVQAGQIGRWTPLVPLSYGGMATIVAAHADLFRDAAEDIA